MKYAKVLTALGLLTAAGAANAEVSGSMAIASSYHWRGFDLGSGTPAISGELRYTVGGFYVAGWASSGDAVAGTELDLYAGYAGSVGGFTYDISYISYIYPTGQFNQTESYGDFAEVIGKVGYGPVTAFLNYNVAGTSKSDILNGVPRYAFPEGEYMYYGVSGKIGPVTLTLAKHDEKVWDGVDFVSATDDNPGVTGDATHFDVTYAYNDNLSFTASHIVDSKLADEPETKLVVAYSVPFK